MLMIGSGKHMKRTITIRHPRRYVVLGALVLALGGYYGNQSRSSGDERPAEIAQEDEANTRTLEGRIVKREECPGYTGSSNVRQDASGKSVTLKLEYVFVKGCDGNSYIFLNQLNEILLNSEARIKFRSFKTDEWAIPQMNSYTRLIDGYIRMGYITNDGSSVKDIEGIILPGGIRYR